MFNPVPSNPAVQPSNSDKDSVKAKEKGKVYALENRKRPRSLDQRSDDNFTDIESISRCSSDSLSSLELKAPSPSLRKRAKTVDFTEQEGETASKLEIEAKHVEAWKSSLATTQDEVKQELRLESRGFWQRLIDGFVYVFLSIFNPSVLKQTEIKKALDQEQIQTAFHQLFEQIIPKMAEAERETQNGSLLFEIEKAFSKVIEGVSPISEEEKKRCLINIENQLKTFLEDHGQSFSQVNSMNPSHASALAAALMSAARKGLGCEANSKTEETIDLSMTFATRRNESRYIVDAKGLVRESSGFNERLNPGEIDFLSYQSLARDIERDGAQINGKTYYTLSEATQALLALDLKPSDIGNMLSFFSQNTFNMLTVPITLGYDLNDGIKVVYATAFSRFRSLEIDQARKTYQLSAALTTGIMSPSEGHAKIFAPDEDKDVHELIVSDLSIQGHLGQEQATASLEQYHAIHSRFEKTKSGFDGINAASHCLSNESAIFKQGELQVLKDEAEKWEQIAKTIASAQKQIPAASRLILNNQGALDKLNTSGKGRRFRKNVTRTREKVDVFLERVKNLQKSTLASKKLKSKVTSFSELEALATQFKENFKTIESMTYGQLQEDKAHPAYVWALGILDKHYESLAASKK